MPKVSLDSNCIQIELTQAEVASYGFGLNRSQLLRKSRGSGGGLLLQLFSIDSTKTLESSEIAVWIPPAQTYPVSSGSQEPLTPRRVVSPITFLSDSKMTSFTGHFSGVSGYHPHDSDPILLSSVTDAGSVNVIGSHGEPSPFSPPDAPNRDVTPLPLPPPQV